MRWIVNEAVRPFLGSEDKPPPELPSVPLMDEYETPEEMLDRAVRDAVPTGAVMVGKTRVYTMEEGSGWIFLRSPDEFRN